MNYKLLLCIIFLLSQSTQAYLSIGESAEVLPEKTYQFGFEPQLFVNEGGGMNWGAFFDAGLTESSSLRAHLNTGKVDFNTMISYKYIPFPDVDRQPAMGIRTGLGLTRSSNENSLILQLAPIMSKKISSQYGPLTPYAAISFNMFNTKSETYVGSQMVCGTEFSIERASNFRWTAEAGLSLNRSYSYISITVSVPLDKFNNVSSR